MIIWTNGPRVTWHRMPSLALSLFIAFKINISGANTYDAVVNILDIALSLIGTAWMLSEQIIFSRQTRAHENGSDEEIFVKWTIGRRLKQKGKTVAFNANFRMNISGKIFPLVLLSTTFRCSSFALIATTLGFYSIPLYMFLVLGPITLDYVYNGTKDRFVIRGMTSAFSGNKRNIRKKI